MENMNVFERKGIFKNNLENIISENQNLMRLLYYSDDDPLSKEHKDIEYSDVRNTHIFMTPKAFTSINNDGETLIGKERCILEFKIVLNSTNNGIGYYKLVPHVLIYNDLLDIVHEKGLSRDDAIFSELHKSIMSSHNNIIENSNGVSWGGLDKAYLTNTDYLNTPFDITGQYAVYNIKVSKVE